jgi:peptide deformylase
MKVAVFLMMREDVYRNERITIEYCEEDFVVKTEVLRV